MLIYASDFREQMSSSTEQLQVLRNPTFLASTIVLLELLEFGSTISVVWLTKLGWLWEESLGSQRTR